MISRRHALASLAAAPFAATAASAAAATPAAADALLAAILERDGGPGAMAAVVLDGKLVWSGAAGKADLEADAPLTSRTRMRTGSLAKPFTAAICLNLAEAGKLDLDGDIRALVPELTAPAKGIITPALLAAHLSGMRQYDFANYLEANNVQYFAELSAALPRYAGDPLRSQPGEAFHYSSLGYNILGIACERAAKRSYGALLQELVAAPLGLGDTLIDHPLEIIPSRTRFYTLFPDGKVRNTVWRDSSDFYPSGGMLSTAENLARFASAAFDGGFLGAASLRRATTELSTNGGAASGYAFGWQVLRKEGAVDCYAHGGETNGAYASLRYYPRERCAVAGMVNTNRMGGQPYFFEAIRTVLPALFRAA